MKLKHLLLLVTVLVSATALTANAQSAKDQGFVVITKFLKADGKKDVSDAIQKVIDANPNKTIYFPDGTYLISKPIVTPADPEKSVALELSNFAVIKATDDWDNEEAMVRLGGKDPKNIITVPGSNYYLQGGVIYGNGKAKGVSIDGGRETQVRNVNIKNVSLGLHIKHGANSGSSDCDINNVNITGNCQPDCIGVLIEGYDNTLTNMRIGGVQIGVKVKTGGNYLRNIHPLYYNFNDEYPSSCGFVNEGNNNWFDFCYSDQFAIGFLTKNSADTYHNCFVYWYSNKGPRHTAFKSLGKFNSCVMNLTVGMGKHNAAEENFVLDAAEAGGTGQFFRVNIGDASVLTDHSHDVYLR